MTIETKYNIGDKVWLMFNDSVSNEKIEKISITVEKRNLDIYKTIYYKLVNYSQWYEEQKFFSTKKDLIDSL